MHKHNSLEYKVGDYWAISLYWNGRVDMEGRVPTFQEMCKVLQNNLCLAANCSQKLANLYNKLLSEVIMHGQKPEHNSALKDNVVHLKEVGEPTEYYDHLIVNNQQ